MSLLLLLLSMVLWTLCDKHCMSAICHPVCHLLAGCVGVRVERSTLDLVTSSVECAGGRGGTVLIWGLPAPDGYSGSLVRNEIGHFKSLCADQVSRVNWESF